MNFKRVKQSPKGLLTPADNISVLERSSEDRVAPAHTRFELVASYPLFLPYESHDKCFAILMDQIRQKTLHKITKLLQRILIIVANDLCFNKFQLSFLLVLLDKYAQFDFLQAQIGQLQFLPRFPALRDFRATPDFNALFNQILLLILMVKVATKDVLSKEMQHNLRLEDDELLFFHKFYQKNTRILGNLELFELNSFYRVLTQGEHKHRSFSVSQMVDTIVNSK